MECNQEHGLVGDFAFHLLPVELTLSDGSLEAGVVLELCEVATTILVDHSRTFGGAVE